MMHVVSSEYTEQFIEPFKIFQYSKKIVLKIRHTNIDSFYNLITTKHTPFCQAWWQHQIEYIITKLPLAQQSKRSSFQYRAFQRVEHESAFQNLADPSHVYKIRILCTKLQSFLKASFTHHIINVQINQNFKIWLSDKEVPGTI